MKKIVVMPVKNEEWILDKSLAAASLWADHIIIADQGSTDATLDVCGKFPKVMVVRNESQTLDQSYARQLLLNTVRRTFGTGNVIFALDADEILSANVVADADFSRLLENLSPGQSVILQWLMLWGSHTCYRADDSIWGTSWKNFIFRDDGVSNFGGKKTSEPRIPDALTSGGVRYEKVKVLHYEFVSWERMLSKQRRYMVYDYLQHPGFLRAIYINHFYYPVVRTPLEKGVNCLPLPVDWLKAYGEIDLANFRTDRVFWYDEDVLKKISSLGEKTFRWLNIWSVDWETISKMARDAELRNISGNKLRDRRNWLIKFYHRNMGVFHPILKIFKWAIFKIYQTGNN